MNSMPNSSDVDAITLSVLWNSLLSIADEMGTALRRTAFSEAVREGDDFSTGIFDGRGRLIAQGNFTPGHLGAMPYVIENVLKYHAPESLRPGDSILLNDSFLGGGHFPDFFLTSPVFRDGRIIAYTVTTAHQVDMGGAAPGSQRVQGITEAYQEGLRILPIRVVREGKFDEDLMRMILGNVRVPAKVRGDLMAQLNANHVGAERLMEMYATYGVDTMARTIDTILEQSESETRAIIARLPAGRYEFEDVLDDAGPDTGPIKVRVAVTIDVSGNEIDSVLRRSTGVLNRGFAPDSALERAWPGETQPRAEVVFDGRDALFADIAGDKHRSSTHAFPESHFDVVRPDAFMPHGPLHRFEVLATSMFCGLSVVAAGPNDTAFPNPAGAGRCAKVTETFRSTNPGYPVIGAQFHAEQLDFTVPAKGDPAESVADSRLFVAAAYEQIVDAYVRFGD